MYTKGWNGQFKKNVKLLNLNNLSLCLEIGCFEGLTSNYMIENMISKEGKLICVDPLTDNYINDDISKADEIDNAGVYKFFNGQYNRFIENTKNHRENNKLILYRNLSKNVYPELIDIYKEMFDFIYIDGDHRAEAVYSDAINCFELCKINGIILFDDYNWNKYSDEKSTKHGILKFLNEYNGKYEILIENYQIAIKKI